MAKRTGTVNRAGFPSIVQPRLGERRRRLPRTRACANLFALNGPNASNAIRFWTRLEDCRKRPWRLFRRFGTGNFPRSLSALGETALKVRITFYSDHHTDWPLFHWAHTAFAVNPTRKLKTVTRRRGIPVVKW